MGADLHQLHIIECFEPFEHCLRFSLSSDNYLVTIGSGGSIQFVEEVDELGELFSVHNVNQLGASYICKVGGVATSEEISFHLFVSITFEVACKSEVIRFHAKAILGNVGAFIKGDSVGFAKLTCHLKVEVLLNPLTVIAIVGNLSF